MCTNNISNNIDLITSEKCITENQQGCFVDNVVKMATLELSTTMALQSGLHLCYYAVSACISVPASPSVQCAAKTQIINAPSAIK